MYLNNMDKICQVVNPAEEKILIRKAQKGNRKAMNKLILANFRFVISIANHYKNTGLPFDDRVNEGVFGLVRAVKKFDENRNINFISYAVWWIRQHIRVAIAFQGKFFGKLPIRYLDYNYQARKETSTLMQCLGRIPTLKEVSEKLNVPDTCINKAQVLCNETASLYTECATNEKGESVALINLIPADVESPTDIVDRRKAKKIVEDVLNNLTDLESTIVKLRYFHKMTYREIGEKTRRSHESARQICHRAIKHKIHSYKNLKKLREIKSIIYDS